MNIINITSQNELPAKLEFYLFNDEKNLELINQNATVYCLTRRIKKEYKEWYVVNEKK